jgi:hypothetical protein
MALTKTIETSHGLTLNNAYIKIIEVSGNKSLINILVVSFKDKEASDNGKNYLTQNSYHFAPSLEMNFIMQGYEYLKTLPAFDGAVDC